MFVCRIEIFYTSSGVSHFHVFLIGFQIIKKCVQQPWLPMMASFMVVVPVILLGHSILEAQANTTEWTLHKTCTSVLRLLWFPTKTTQTNIHCNPSCRRLIIIRRNTPVTTLSYRVWSLEIWVRSAHGRMIIASDPTLCHEEFAIATIMSALQAHNVHQLQDAIADVIEYFDGKDWFKLSLPVPQH